MRMVLCTFVYFLFFNLAFSQLNETGENKSVNSDTLSEQSNELKNLQKSAQQMLPAAESSIPSPLSRTFQQGSRSLQALNPELSITGDMVSKLLLEKPYYTDEERSGFSLRVVEVALQSNLDPFSKAKVILEFSPEEIGVAEMYATWINPLPRLNITAGKFRQEFGVVNRWHKHALDQIAYPLPVELYFGEEGLSQTGISANWLMPSLVAGVNEMTLQLTNSENETLFSGEEFSLPATLLHLKNYYDINPSTYFEWGVSGLVGTNDSLGLDVTRSHRWTYMAGLDLTLSWIPVNRALYKGMTWRSELFYLKKEIPASRVINAFGAYSYVDYRLNRRWIVGMRGDMAQPLQIENDDYYLWKIVPYLTFRQSEYVYFRLEYSHLGSKNLEEKDNRLTLQLNWSVGPHRHERY